MNNLVEVITALGLGSLITAFATDLLGKNKELEFKKLEAKAKRYKSTLLFMDAFFKPKNIKYLSGHHPDINSSEDVIEYLRAEYHEMLLYASKNVALAVKHFIETPSNNTFLAAILEMRKDLWISKSDLRIDEIALK